MEFPHFDGRDPKRWLMNCEFYFEMYEVPEVYKTRMAVMNFSEELHEWYRCLTTRGHRLPWELLVEKVMVRFQGHEIKHPVDEFKRIHQVGRVEKFIKRFDRTRARLLLVKPTLDEEFFVAGFISGLKEELRHTVELFNPRRLNSVFQCAIKVEVVQEVQQKRPKEVNKGFKYQKYPSIKVKPDSDRIENKEAISQKTWQPKPSYQNPSYQNPSYEQRKALGLCHKCYGKYFPGHQYTGKVLWLMSDSKSDERGDEDESDNEEGEQLEEVEHAMISMYTSCDKKKISSMKFKGHVGKVPICALLDSGSTHSFINPVVIKKLSIPTFQTNPMVVRVANGEKMVTDTACKALKFDLQGYKFEKEVRLLAIQGYDMILGLD